MTPGPVLRRVLLGIALVVLLGLAWTGIEGAITQLPGARTAGRRIQTAMQLSYGVLALLSIATAFRGDRWNRLLLVCWTIALALAGGMGATAWGGTSLLTGVVSGLASGLIGAGIAWLLRIGARRTLVP